MTPTCPAGVTPARDEVAAASVDGLLPLTNREHYRRGLDCAVEPVACKPTRGEITGYSTRGEITGEITGIRPGAKLPGDSPRSRHQAGLNPSTEPCVSAVRCPATDRGNGAEGALATKQ
jgi:hypothetical protein